MFETDLDPRWQDATLYHFPFDDRLKLGSYLVRDGRKCHGGEAELFRIEDLRTGELLKDRVARLFRIDEKIESGTLPSKLLGPFLQMALSHDRVVRCDEVGRLFEPRAKRTLYFQVLERGDVGLDDMIHRADFSLEDRLLALADVMEALDYCHRLNVAHCDLKPENVIGFRDAETGIIRWKLSDFGLVRLLVETIPFSVRRGTDHYYPPELSDAVYDESAARAAEAMRSPLSDVFSFALMSMEVMMGGIRKDIDAFRWQRKIIREFNHWKEKVLPTLSVSDARACEVLETLLPRIDAMLSADRDSRPSWSELHLLSQPVPDIFDAVNRIERGYPITTEDLASDFAVRSDGTIFRPVVVECEDLETVSIADIAMPIAQDWAIERVGRDQEVCVSPTVQSDINRIVERPIALKGFWDLPPDYDRHFTEIVRRRLKSERLDAKVFDEQKVRLSGDVEAEGLLDLHRTSYFKSLVTNQSYERRFSCEESMFVGSEPSRSTIRLTPHEMVVWDGILQPFSTSGASNHIGASMFVIMELELSDGERVVICPGVTQGDGALVRHNRLASSCSGSLDWGDAEEAATLGDAVRNGLRREMTEEVHIDEDFAQSVPIFVTGFFRVVDRGSKPDFTGIAVLRGRTKDVFGFEGDRFRIREEEKFCLAKIGVIDKDGSLNDLFSTKQETGEVLRNLSNPDDLLMVMRDIEHRVTFAPNRTSQAVHAARNAVSWLGNREHLDLVHSALMGMSPIR